MMLQDLRCPVCRDELPDPGDGSQPMPPPIVGARITTEIAQLLRCEKGHEFLVHFQDGGHALLYERALQRLADGRTRDAVLDAYTAFDMFLGWIVLGTLFGRRAPASVPIDQVPLEPLREEIKEVLRSSERTLGAAITLATVLSGRPPPKLDGRLQALRNRAVHAGQYPSDREAEWACLEVDRLVCALGELLPLATFESDPYPRFQFALLVESRERALAGRAFPRHTVTILMLTVLNASHPFQRGGAERLDEYRRGKRPFLIE